MNERDLHFTLNGTKRTFRVAPNELLINLIRDHAHCTGTKYGCGIGECGACTVQIDGRPALACLTLAVSVADKKVLTIEGLAGDDLHPLQEAFVEHSAVQCGFCTPGMIMAAKSLLDQEGNPSEEEIREYLRGNICRCTGYSNIVRAVKACSGS
ncbi:MAG TPA: (2Fe-2S)-binding protein [Symbiobacteriaceae bacterium]|nr:(2Fe-2S)-binding protein [Symbiobacteriaceae bacterium]